MKLSRIFAVGAIVTGIMIAWTVLKSPPSQRETVRSIPDDDDSTQKNAEGKARSTGSLASTGSFDKALSDLEHLTALSIAQDRELNALKSRARSATPPSAPTLHQQPQLKNQGGNPPLAMEAPARVGYPPADDPRKECTDIMVGVGNPPLRNDTYQCRQTDVVLVHIPKTGGTSIEQAAMKSQSKLLWGLQYDKARFRKKRGGLPLKNGVESLIPVCKGNFGKKCCSWWHVPPRYVNDWRPYYSALHRFCAVRDPYARVLSEYMFRHGKEIRKLPCEEHNKTELNGWLRARMQAQVDGANTLDDCHWYPQYQYIEPNLGTIGLPAPHAANPGNSYIDAGPDGRSCNKVLRMESLSADFATLMSELGHPEIKLSKQKSFSSGCKDLQMLEPETRELIKSTYRQDFLQFGYPM